VEVTRQANTARITVDWLSGDRYKFGQVNYEGAQFDPEFLDRFIPWKPGDYYSPDQLLAFQQRLVDADYFGSVLVQPVLERGRPEGVPIQVDLAPAKRTVYTAGAYISTDTGPGVRFGMNRRWVNRDGHKAKIDLDYAQRRESASLGYQIPLPGPNDRSYNFGSSYIDEDTDTSTSRTGRITANETRQWLGFTRTLGVQFITGNFEIGSEERYSSLAFAEATLSRKSTRNAVFPRRGYSMNFSVRFAPETEISDTAFTQATLDAKWLRGVARRQRVLLRGSVGTMVVDDFDQLHPELRYFAGGDLSIRGFDYEALGSTNAAGEVIGGTNLAIGSVEYEYYFLRDWGIAAFADGGDAFKDGEFNLNIGAGLGLRWRSPVGVVRVDIATPVKHEIDIDQKIRFHIRIGPDL
jgi:translocation and assembly module TamA